MKYIQIRKSVSLNTDIEIYQSHEGRVWFPEIRV